MPPPCPAVAQEKRLISKFFDEISQDTNKHTSGVKDTLACLEMGAVETLIVWENLDIQRLELRNPTSGEQEQDPACFLALVCPGLKGRKVIVWQDLDIQLLNLHNPTSGWP